jgi:hypothetical protein
MALAALESEIAFDRKVFPLARISSEARVR